MSASSPPTPPPTTGADRTAIVAIAVLLVAAGLWLSALPALDLRNLNDYGALPELPLRWYAALLILTAGAATLVTARRARSGIALLYVVAVALVLFATVPLASEVPHYPWVYKHIGVTRAIDFQTGLDPSVDIYQRWPGFFALSAVFSRIAGLPNPVDYAALAEPFFAVVNALLVATLGRTLTRSLRTGVLAALLFTAANWIGQSYYAPQALAFTLTLGLYVVLLRATLSVDGAAGRRLMLILTRLAGASPEGRLSVSGIGWPRAAAIAVVLGLHATVVVSHQLTPYMLIAGVAILVALGFVRPVAILAGLVVLAVGFLALNLGYVAGHFGVFTSFDPFANAERGNRYVDDPLPGKVLSAQAGQLLTALVCVATPLAGLRLMRLGRARAALLVGVLGAAPIVVIFGQSYGGEALFRVYLFALPWLAVLIAWGLATVHRPRVRQLMAIGGATTAAGLCVVAALGQEELFQIARGEVSASERLYERGRPGGTLMLAAFSFPKRVGPGYARFAGPLDEDEPNLLQDDLFRHRPLGVRDVPLVVERMSRQARRGYLVFSVSQTRFARVFQLTPPGALDDLETAIAVSRQFRLWHRNGDARIYEFDASGDFGRSGRRSRG